MKFKKVSLDSAFSKMKKKRPKIAENLPISIIWTNENIEIELPRLTQSQSEQIIRFYNTTELKKGWQNKPFYDLPQIEQLFVINLFHIHLIKTIKE